MSVDKPDLVAQCLRHPAVVEEFSISQWELLIRQAVGADLIARLALKLLECRLLSNVPAAPRRHLEAAITFARSQHEGVAREVGHIALALAESGIRPILLKGAAYLTGGLRASSGRMFMDVDILVPRERLGDTEAALMLHGWLTSHHDAYDQHYYRQWMHEIPPMQHIHRGTVLDAHHSILPLIGRMKFDPHPFFESARSAPADDRVQVLSPADMVLHSATHLFMNEEFSHGLRDLSDLDLLLREFGSEEVFWTELIDRASQVRLGRPLFYALRYTRMLLDTQVPAAVVERSSAFAPRRTTLALMDRLWIRALRSPHPSTADLYSPMALFALYLRAHWMRMPPARLVRHLITKAWRRVFEKGPAE